MTSGSSGDYVFRSMPLIVSFYTDRYVKPAAKLKESCARFGLSCYLHHYDPPGKKKDDWRRNCAYKGVFMRDMLLEHKAPIVWVDADAQIVGQPRLFKTIDCDFAAYWPPSSEKGRLRRHLMSGTLFVNWTPKGIELMERWAKACQVPKPKWDQRILTEVWEAWKPKSDRPKFYNLPQAYCKVWDTFWRVGENRQDVIRHFQYSRDVKGRRRPSGYRGKE